jgi:hypothetical protein
MCLLPRQGDAHIGFRVFGRFAAQVHSRAVKRTGEFVRGLIFGPDRGAGVGAAHHAPSQTDRHRHGERDIARPDWFAVDKEMPSTGSSLAVLVVHLAGRLEFEAQLMATSRDGFFRFL